MAKPDYNIVISPDSYLLLEKIAQLTEQYPGQGQTWQKNVFWGDELPDSRFWNALAQQGLFNTPRVIIIRNAELWPQNVWKGLNDTLTCHCQDIWPFLCLEVEMEKGKFKVPAHIQKLSIYSEAQKNGWIVQLPPLQGPGLSKYVLAQAQKRNLKFAPNALPVFCTSVMPRAAAINSELDKIELANKDGIIDMALAKVQGADPEWDAFKLVGKLESGNLVAIWEDVARPGASSLLFFLVALLARELRLFWQIVNNENPWIHPSESPFKRKLAKELGFNGITEGFNYLVEAEWQIKSGQQSVEQVMDWIVTNFAFLFAGKSFK